MNALVRYAASLIDSIALTRPTGAAFVWPHDVPAEPPVLDRDTSPAPLLVPPSPGSGAEQDCSS